MEGRPVTRACRGCSSWRSSTRRGSSPRELRFVKSLIDDIETKALDGVDMWKAFHDEGTIPLEGVTLEIQIHHNPE